MAEKKEKPSDFQRVAGIAGNVLGAFSDATAGDTVTTPGMSGFESLPEPVKKLMLEEMFPDIAEQYSMPRPRPMMRQYTEAEAADPIFGSPTRLYMQNIRNYERVPQAGFEGGGGSSAQAVASPQAQPALRLDGYDTESQTYTTPFGQMIQGDAGKRAAENKAIERQLMDVYGGNQTNKEQTLQRIGSMLAAFTDGGEDVRTNKYNKLKYDRSKMLDALMSGNTGELQRQGAAAGYAPASGMLTRFAPLAAGAALGLGASAAGFSPLVSKVAGQIASELPGAM